MKRQVWLSALVGMAGLAVQAPARAAATENVIQIAAGFRYGISMNDGDLNPWGAGLGLSAGYTLPAMPIYVGGNVEYFFGGKVQVQDAEIKSHVLQVSAEGGYDIGVLPMLVLRPKLGLGIASMSTEACAKGVCSDTGGTKPLVAPGATAIIFAGKFTLSVDARYAVVFADETAKALIFTAGIGF
jgi:hypothetical protein